jgi:Skp family chaperone for outer membrane proteins
MTTQRRTYVTMGFTALAAIGFMLFGMRQAPTAAPAPAKPQTKVAVLNLSYVMKNYKKWKQLQEQYKTKQDAFETEVRQIKAAVDLKQQQAATAEDIDRRKALKNEVQDLLNRMSERTEEGKKQLGELEKEAFAKTYVDIRSASETYAKANGIELIMHCRDGTPEQQNDTAIIAIKYEQTCLYPLYVAPGMDISKEIVAMLNDEKAPDDK